MKNHGLRVSSRILTGGLCALLRAAPGLPSAARAQTAMEPVATAAGDVAPVQIAAPEAQEPTTAAAVFGPDLSAALIPLNVSPPAAATWTVSKSVSAGPSTRAAAKLITGRAAAKKMAAVRAALADPRDIAQAPAGELHGLGIKLEDAYSGVHSQAGEGPDDAVAAGAVAPVHASLLTRPTDIRRHPAGKSELQSRIEERSKVINAVRDEVGKVIVGQKEMIDAILMGAIASEHVLLEGVPGVAKTQTVKAFADAVDGEFQRIQGTPDLQPSDITGGNILQEEASGEKSWKFSPGPIFANVLLADELNRTMPKTQSAFLEAMQEGKVTVGRKTLDLPQPFFVLATMNPIEQEGTYRLTEAQQDRFMLKVVVGLPAAEELKTIMRRFSRREGQPKASKVATLEDLAAARRLAEQIRVEPELEQYIVDIVMATREPKRFGLDFKDAVENGASPRAAIFLAKAARIQAFLKGRDYVDQDDVKTVAKLVLRHRIRLGYQAGALTSDAVVDEILKRVPMGPQPAQDQSPDWLAGAEAGI